MRSYLTAVIIVCCIFYTIDANVASSKWEKVDDEELYREFGVASVKQWINTHTILMAPACYQTSIRSAPLLLDDDFEDGGYPAWDLEGNWSIYSDNGNNVLKGEGHYWANIGSPDWRVSRFQMKMKLIQGGLHINLDVNDDGRYFLGFNNEGLYLSRQFDQWRQFADLSSVSKRFDLERWHLIEIFLGDPGDGAKIEVYVDGVQLLTSSDDYYNTGSIAYESLDNSTVYVDDIHVEGTGATCGDNIKNGDEEGIDCGGSCPDSCNGVGWVQTKGPPGGYINDIAIDPVNPSILYAAGSREGIYKSMDGGNNWQLLRFPEHQFVQNIEVDPQNPNILYCGYRNLSKSSDGGISWHEIDRGFGEMAHLQVLRLEPTNSDVLYMAGGKYDGTGIAVFKTRDGGQNWQNITGNLNTPPGSGASALAVLGNGRILVGVNDWQLQTWHRGKAFYSDNDGRTWNEIDLVQPEDRFIFSIFANPFDLQEVWISEGPPYNNPISQPLLYKSSNGGVDWEPIYINVGFDSTQVRVIGASSDGRVYVSGGGLLLFTDNGGASFISIALPSDEMTSVDFTNIAVHPDNPDILFLPLRGSGIAYSEDGGISWTLRNKGIVNTDINLLAVDPVDPSVVYASSTKGVGTFRSDDYGESWTRLNEGGIVHAFGDELTVDPVDGDNVWYIADVPYIHKSADRGNTWQVLVNPYRGGDFNFCSVYAIGQSSDSNIMYALSNGMGIFKSTDAGKSWELLHQSEVDYTYSIAVHPTNPDIVYSGYSPKPFQDFAMIRRTLDGGDSWETVLEVPGSTGIVSVVIDPSDPDVIYAGSTGKGGQVYKSIDGGDSWSKLNEHFTMCTVWGQPQLIVHPDNPSIVYAGTWLGGTWKTEDAGETWMLLEEAPISSTALSLNTQDTNVIYLADRSTPTVWKSTDAGLTWEKVADFSRDGALLVMRVLADGDTVYAATFHPSLRGGKLYKSSDSGSTWGNITGTLPKGILDVAVDPSNPDIVYVTTNINGAYTSTDGGMTWTQLLNFPDVGAYDIEVDPVDPAILYTSARGGSMPAWFTEIAGDRPDGIAFTDDAGVYKSTDSGATWTQILTTSASCRVIRLHPDNHNILFAIDLVDGLMVSTDGGDSWSNQNTGLDTVVLTSCAVGGDKIYAGTQGCGVYSGDLHIGSGAVTWQPSRSNKPVPEVYSLQIEIDPTNSDRVFVSSYPGGLYCSDDGGATFRDKNGITPSVVVDDPFRQGYYTFAINPSNPDEMWLGTWGKGVFKSYNAMNLDIPANGTDMKMLGKHVYRIVIEPRSNAVYVATQEGVFRSSDGGQNWIEMNQGLPPTDVRVLHLNADGELYAGTIGYGLFKWENGHWEPRNAFGNFGTFWPIWDNRPLYQYTSLLINPNDSDIMYMGTFPAGIYKSIDGGQTWLEKNVGWTNDGVFCLVFHPNNNDIIYAGTYNGVNRSLDAGEHWQMWDEGFPPEQWVFSIDFDPANPDIMYAASKNGKNEGRGEEGFHGTVMKSIDGGKYWFEIAKGLDKNQEFYKIIVDRFDRDRLYLATQRSGVFISLDAGESWTPWNKGLTNLVAGTNGNNVTNTLTLSANGAYLYFGTAGTGVFRRRVTDFPLPVQNLQAVRFENQIILTWDAFNDIDTDFHHFAVYQDISHFSNVSQLAPIHTITDISATQYRDANILQHVDYYYAITAVDVKGNENKQVTPVLVARQFPSWDVNKDGCIDASDLALIGSRFGEDITTPSDPNPDVNDDGKVDIRDLVLVSRHFGEIYLPATAPRDIWSFDPKYLPTLVKMYNIVAEYPDSDADVLTTKRLLHRLIFNARTGKTELLQNYPNPCNPETWIPYQLAEDLKVTIRVYSVTGRLIKLLNLGHKGAGLYMTKHTAAYWDGTTDTGEHISGGVYFYTIQAGEFTATKKMVVAQ